FTDFVAREALNRGLGLEGEKFVLNFETARLRAEGKARLADRIEHVSAERGDGAGFDIKSFEADGSDRLIEVKTTGYGKETPFYVTSREMDTSRRLENQYQLYRVYQFRPKMKPGLFALPGAIEDSCGDRRPTQYLVRV